MSSSIADEAISDIPPTDGLQVPTVLQHTRDYGSTDNQLDSEDTVTNLKGYDGFDWTRYPNAYIPKGTKGKGKRTRRSWVYDYGYVVDTDVD